MSVTETAQKERKRILEMVQTGAVTPTEGERLLTQLDQRETPQRQCPFCAETISASAEICPECQSRVVVNTAQAGYGQGRTGFHGLNGLGKFLVVYTILVCSIVLLVAPFAFLGGLVFQKLLAILGLVGAIMMCKGVPAGKALCVIWAALQMVPIAVNGVVLNQQVLHLGIMTTTNGDGIGFNAVGLILLILFIKAAPSARASYQQGM